MKQIWLLLKTETAGWKKRKIIVWISVLIVFMISTFSYVTGREETESGKIVLGVANNDASGYSGLLMTYFNENETFLKYVEMVEDAEPKLEQELMAGKMDGYLVIPKDFAQSMIRMENKPIKAVVSMKNPTKALILRYVMEAYETYIEAVEENCTALYQRMKEEGFSSEERNAANVDISLDLIFTALGKDDFFQNQIVEAKAEEELLLTDHYKYTGLYFLFLFFFISAGLRILTLRKSGLPGRLQSMNVSMGSLFAAVMIPYLVPAMLVLGIFMCLTGQMTALLCGFCLVLPWLLVMVLLGAISGNQKNYLFLCSMILTGLAVLGGSLIPEAFLPDVFLKVTSRMPNRMFTYLAAGLLGKTQQGEIIFTSVLVTAVLAIGAVVFLRYRGEVRTVEE